MRNHIEYIHANKGLLIVTSCEEYIIIDLKDKVIVKRGKGSKTDNKVDRLRWVVIVDLDAQEKFVTVGVGKGYNHHNSKQTKEGKPNLHFRTFPVCKKND